MCTANEWIIDCSHGASDYSNGVCSNWYGFNNWDEIGSVSTTFKDKGRAILDFGNCYTSGDVYAHLDGNVIAAAPNNTLSMTVEFNFNIGSILKITEENVGIIQFNSLNIIQCNGNNSEY